jgi:phosphoadenosine phosphosulfate reductase
MLRFPHVRFEAVHPMLSPQEQSVLHGDELWSRDPDACCRIRKVEPMHRAMEGVDVWFTSIQRSQSSSRCEVRIIEWDWQYQLLKICPLASWDRARTYRYVRTHELPYNELHDRGYPSIGCTHCTAQVPGAMPWDYSRDGRWCHSEKTECGLHNGAGI